MIRFFSLVVLILTFPAATLLASERTDPTCSARGEVSISAKDSPVRLFLRDLAEQSGANIAIDPQLRGKVTVHLSCVGVRTALRLALGQVNAVFCEAEKTIYVTRRSRAECAHPQPSVQHVRRTPAE